jgi:hypothetical protein
MACQKIFIQDFVSDNTTISFYNKEYRNHRTEILFSTEKSLLPSTQHLAEQAKKCDLIYTEMNKIKSERKELKTQLDDLNRLLYQKERELYRQQNMSDNPEETQRKQFTKKCQVENCRGYLSSAWKCGQCETFSCSKCHKVKEKGNEQSHECDKNDVETVMFLAKDTKECPSCETPIHKISGCDLMWCPMCQKQFSWKKGIIVTGFNHNPHYYEYLRQQNNGEIERNPLDRGYNNPLTPNTETFQKLRIRYLNNKISEDEWKIVLKREQKKSEKHTEIHQILHMYIETLTDIFRLYVKEDTINLKEQLHNIREYTNLQLTKIKNKYNNVTPYITYRFQIF